MRLPLAFPSLGLMLAAVAALSSGCSPDVAPARAADGARPAVRLHATPLLSVGALEGREGEVFGTAQDVAAGPAGEIYVADSRMQRVSRFDAGGGLVATTGRGGRGPGEFLFVRAVDHDGADRLYVLDHGNQRVDVYRTGGGVLEPHGSFNIDFPATDICLLRGRVFVSGLRHDNLIHEYSPDGRLLRSFAASHQKGDLRLQILESDGYMECVDETGEILFVPGPFPQVRAFSADGERRWESVLADFHGYVFRKTSRGLEHGLDRTGTANFIAGLSYHPRLGVVVQIGTFDSSAPRERQPADTRFLSLRDGSETARQDSLPVFARLVGPHAYLLENDPYPRVTIAHLRLADGG